ncbi:hypothetical protein E6Q11_03665 [Candidatus Dojkabacteria bacterium]|uniref:Uncharacterized protein n=1 Tax=Candidatus Dojkabacteria bacterium TaxID=2099670 RepID=A0A5C7J6A6_9BACT|nr:MAG: hypothetical protein E6Q11_03665 [Candidatus Dojkabacteria bacterium]
MGDKTSSESPRAGKKPAKRKSRTSISDRVRFLVDQCPYKITGIINIGSMLLEAPEHESFLERDAIKLLAMCGDIKAIESQPEVIKYLDQESEERRYTLDLRVTLINDDVRRLEVKPLRRALSGKEHEKIFHVASHCNSLGQALDIVTDDAIHLEPRLSAAIRLRGFIKHQVSTEIRTRVEDVLRSGPLTINKILEQVGDENRWADVLAMVAQHMLCISWREELTRETSVSLPNQPYEYLTYENVLRSGRFHTLLEELALGRRPSDKVLLAAALAENRSVSLPSPMGAVGGIPRRALYVGRNIECQEDRGDES